MDNTEQEQLSPNRRRRGYQGSGMWLAMGIILGVTLGAAFNNVAIGVAIGVVFGIALDAWMARRNR